MRGQRFLSFALVAFATTTLAAPHQGRSLNSIENKAPFGTLDKHFVSARTPIVDVGKPFVGSRKRAAADDDTADPADAATNPGGAEPVAANAPKANANSTLSTAAAKKTISGIGAGGVAAPTGKAATSGKTTTTTAAAKKTTNGIPAGGVAAPTGKTTGKTTAAKKTTSGVPAGGVAAATGKTTAKAKKSTTTAAAAAITAPASAVPTGKAKKSSTAAGAAAAAPAKPTPAAAAGAGTGAAGSGQAADPLAALEGLLSGAKGAGGAAAANPLAALGLAGKRGVSADVEVEEV